MNKWTREWGAVAFVATVVIGALAVGVSLLFSSGVSSGTGPTLPPCPTFAKATPTPVVSPGATAPATVAPSPSATFNAVFANCPTPTAPPAPATSTPKAVPATPTPPPVPTPTPYHPTPLS